MFKVNADLMGAASARFGEHEAGFVVKGGDLDLCNGFSAIGEDGHLFAMDGMAANGHVDDCISWAPLANHEIELLNLARGEELDHFLMGGECFGCDEDAGCIFIEAVDDAGAEWVGAWGDVLAVA